VEYSGHLDVAQIHGVQRPTCRRPPRLAPAACSERRNISQLPSRRESNFGGGQALVRGVVVGLQVDNKLKSGGPAESRESCVCASSPIGRRLNPKAPVAPGANLKRIQRH